MNKNLGEFKVISLRECATVSGSNPDEIESYLRQNVPGASWYDPDKEAAIVILLDTRRKIIGFNLISLGTLDSSLIHPREVFKPAIVASASAVILAHNHPSGDCSPSDADIRVTKEILRAGQLLKIELLDHIVWHETNRRASLRELGYLY